MYYISWDEFENLSLDLSKQIIKSNNNYDLIVCVSRGGLLLGRILSSLLNLNLAVISSKENKSTNEYIIDKNLSSLYPIKGNVLLVDDIFEINGLNIKKYLLSNYKINNIDMASIFYKSKSDFKPEFYINDIKHKVTIVFPYQEKSLKKDFVEGD